MFAKLFIIPGIATASLRNLPSVSFIISAYNEEKIISEKLKNSLDFNYPEDKLEIMVISDASSDNTDNIVGQWASKHSRIRLIRQTTRLGKSIGLNKGIEEAKGEIVVFSDANAMYDSNAIRALVEHFDDKKVGYVIGKALYVDDVKSAAANSENLYWKYELLIKELESRFYSVVGGDGAIYAIRKFLYWSLDADDINDFVNPLQIVAHGYRGIFCHEAVCYEGAAADFHKEFQRKRRIVNRSWRATKKYLRLFDFRKHLLFLFELLSHKIFRWFTWLFLLILLFSNIIIIIINFGGSIYLLFLLGQFLLYLLAVSGYLLTKANKELPSFISIPFYFSLVNIAAFLGILDDLRGKKYTTWNHVRND